MSDSPQPADKRQIAHLIKDNVERLILAQATDDIGAQIAYASAIELSAVQLMNLYEGQED